MFFYCIIIFGSFFTEDKFLTFDNLNCKLNSLIIFSNFSISVIVGDGSGGVFVVVGLIVAVSLSVSNDANCHFFLFFDFNVSVDIAAAVFNSSFDFTRRFGANDLCLFFEFISSSCCCCCFDVDGEDFLRLSSCFDGCGILPLIFSSSPNEFDGDGCCFDCDCDGGDSDGLLSLLLSLLFEKSLNINVGASDIRIRCVGVDNDDAVDDIDVCTSEFIGESNINVDAFDIRIGRLVTKLNDRSCCFFIIKSSNS
ncbi:hypothetical protein DERP_007387 [Dermatophagoides pteronyssinus]|uniref:Uncharacterized protein n=1 Tax=Dermatophagoides pteronyssinus TaxID=6956 RepID=A0ABQ8J485_DERPT|nr:hypothetical protein DERP_007387 [Dermatophagoides pteronyssinus]